MKNKIPEIMKQKGISVSDLSYGARITQNTARRLATSPELGEKESITVGTIESVCRFLEVGISDILILETE